MLGVERIDAVADMGYYKGEDIEACEENGITPYVARPQRGIAVSNGHFPNERFHYDAEEDMYRCPGGQRLDTRYHSVVRWHVTVQYSNPNACAACAIKARCTGGRYRRINRWENEAVLDRMAERLAARPDILAVRRETVEHPFRQQSLAGNYAFRPADFRQTCGCSQAGEDVAIFGGANVKILSTLA